MSEVLFSHIEATSWGSTPGFSHPHYAILDTSPRSEKKNTSHHFYFASSLRSKWTLRPTRDEHGIQI